MILLQAWSVSVGGLVVGTKWLNLGALVAVDKLRSVADRVQLGCFVTSSWNHRNHSLVIRVGLHIQRLDSIDNKGPVQY